MTAQRDAVVVDRSGGCLVVRTAGETGDRPGAGAERLREPGRTAVVVTRAAYPSLWHLDPDLLAKLARLLPPGGMRLLGGQTACRGGDGSPPLAARLADRLGVPVVGADGPVIVLPGGEAFAAGAAGTWWWFPPGQSPAPVGSRSPAPGWQAALPVDLPRRVSRVTATPTPAGLWVRAPHERPAELSDPGFNVPPVPGRLSLVVGRPGEEPPSVAGLAEVVRLLPATLRRRYTLVPYGPDQAGEPLAQQLADHLDADVRTLHALPWYRPDGSLGQAALDAHGRPAWCPFVSVTVHHPGGRSPTPWAWMPPADGLETAGPGSYRLAAGWVLDVVPSGLVVRPAGAAADPLLAQRGTDPRWVDLAVTARGVPGAVVDAIGRLARALPWPARDRLRLLVAGGVSGVDIPALAALAAELRLRPHHLGADGVLSAAEPSEAVRLPADRSRDVSSTPSPAADPPAAHEPPGAPEPAPAPDGAGAVAGRPVVEDAPPDVPPPAPAPPDVPPPAPAPPDVPPPAPAPPAPAPPQPRAGTPGPPTAGLGGSDVPPPAAKPPPRPAIDSPAPHRSRPRPAAIPDDAPPANPGSPARHPLVSSAVPPAIPPAVPPSGAIPPRRRSDRPPTIQDGQYGIAVAADVEAAAAATAAAKAAATPTPFSRPPAPARQLPSTRRTAPGLAERWVEGTSSEDERRRFRGSLGRRYDAASGQVTRLLSERPALRAGAADDDGLRTDLAAVYVFAADPGPLMASIRSGTADGPYLACLVSGLIRLPTLAGLVVGRLETLDGYVPGAEVIEAAPLVAGTDRTPGRAEMLIWSSTARRLDGLVEDDASVRVVFLPGTAFRVVDVTIEPRQILLVERPAGWADDVAGEREARMTARLRTAAGAGAGVTRSEHAAGRGGR